MLQGQTRLDAGRLQQATAQRQDLLFEIESEGPDRLAAEMDEDVRELAVELRDLDRRLTRVLESGLAVIGRVGPSGEQSKTYAPNGRIRGPR